MINPIDTSVIHYLNQLPMSHDVLNQAMDLMLENLMLQGGVIMTMFWWIWFREGEHKTRDREYVVAGIVASVIACLVARGASHLLPFRERPLFTPELHFTLPAEYMRYHLIYWSSFPSDHAVLYFCLATSVFLASWRLGCVAYLYASFIVCLPRVYFGIHFPTDIIAGAILGVGLGSIFAIERVREFVTRRPLGYLKKSPAIFLPCMFLATFVIGTDFESLRTVAVFSIHATKALVHAPDMKAPTSKTALASK